MLGWVVWEGKIYMIHIGFITDFFWVNVDAKKCDSCCKFKVSALGVGCWGWVIEGCKMHMIRIDFVTDLMWVKFDAKKCDS